MNNLAQIHQGLEDAGYRAKITEDALIVTLDGGFSTVLVIDDNNLNVTCQLAVLGEFHEENMTKFAFAALDANSRITPYAVSLITERDDESIADPSEYVVTLVDSIPLGDFEQPELESAMQALLTAIVGCREVLEAGCAEVQEEPKTTVNLVAGHPG